jgi:hypothetical protein
VVPPGAGAVASPGAVLNKVEKGFEDAGEVEKPARRRKAAKQNRRWPDMKTPGAGPRLCMTFSRDLGRNATQIRQRRGILWITRMIAKNQRRLDAARKLISEIANNVEAVPQRLGRR